VKVIYATGDSFKPHLKAAGWDPEAMESMQAQAEEGSRRVKESTEAINKRMTAPSISSMASNFTSSMAKWVGAGFKTVDEELYNKRLLTCRECEHWKEAGIGRCMKCGCAGIKLWLATEKCPIDKW